MTEQQLQQAIWAAFAGWREVRIWRINAGGRPGENGGWFKGAPAGHPDLTGFLAPHGRWFGLEVKTPEGKQSAQQAAFQAAAAQRGALYAVVRSPEEAMTVVDGWLKEERAR